MRCGSDKHEGESFPGSQLLSIKVIVASLALLPVNPVLSWIEMKDKLRG